ncbi:hypothetical protein MKA27_13185 [[Clostridium] innocuum]|uniref:hypothetical protein n=1 Tax=Clostridium innocuum TaxID=1522 RepID=UPI000D6A96E4|nr:hypothetical protein [[Clostridium] innocuum]MCR0315262.1 hypothetical protein [[Clostridium] innocuum]MCR0369716.1 hypothetical protein [[Clostridium] innocuum]MCR0374773.1 hypothetical protein [[Clostridium] innocuum]MCR0559669.1 hypothetical protein [[Clostridium] innocuum]MCR0602637.1 hypothetical protein [[Clostridium] innocuum]
MTNKKKYLYFAVISVFIFLLASHKVYAIDESLTLPGGGTPISNKNEVSSALGLLIKYGYYFINGLLGVGLFTSVIAFIKTSMSIANSNAKTRPQAIKDLTSITITTACLGGFPLFFVGLITLLKI